MEEAVDVPLLARCRVAAEPTVLSKRESASRTTQGIVTVETIKINQDSKIVITFERTMLIYKPDHSPEEAVNY
ncbi:hotdog family protein [Caballeronia mineralivorans]|uniref:hypothetical protein n=1 Tax=Caballeronia mineralivorans TaxID=2010198 RepID=UPI00069FA16F